MVNIMWLTYINYCALCGDSKKVHEIAHNIMDIQTEVLKIPSKWFSTWVASANFYRVCT